jgi:nudix-type nucleoside diphosphatase (YffH/AdpP family)
MVPVCYLSRRAGFAGADKMPKHVVITEPKKRILDDFFKVDEVHLSFEKFDGSMSKVVRRLNFERGDSVAALLHHRERDAVLLVNQFRYPTYQKGPGWITEIVAGMIDAGENPEVAMRREILEETGYRVEQLVHISDFYLSPGGSSERIFLFCAEISGAGPQEKGGGLAVENEDIRLLELSTVEAFGQLDRGEIRDAKTIVALMWLRGRLGLEGG